MKNLFFGFALLLMLCGAYSVPAFAGNPHPPVKEMKKDLLSSHSYLEVSAQGVHYSGFSDAILPEGVFIPRASNDYLFALLNYNREVRRMELEAKRVFGSIAGMGAVQPIEKLPISKRNS